MELRGHEPRGARQFNDLDQPVVREARKPEAGMLIGFQVVVVELIAVPVALGDLIAAIEIARQSSWLQLYVLRAQAHGAAELRALIPRLRVVRTVLLFGDQRDDPVRRGAIELGAVGIRQLEHVAAVFDDRELHPQADAEIRHAVFTGEPRRLDLALDAAFAESARHQYRVHARQAIGAVGLDIGRFDVVQSRAGAGLEAAVHERLIERYVGIADLYVLADHGDVDLAVRIDLGARHLAPGGQIRRWHIEPQLVDDDVIESLLMQQPRNLAGVVHIDRGDDRTLLDVGEQRDLAPLFIRQRLAAAAQQHGGVDTDRAQFLDRMLRGLGLDLARAADDWHQCQVHVERLGTSKLDAKLADRLQKRQRLDVADRAADLDHGDIGVVRTEQDAALDLIGDVRNDLHGSAQVVAAPLLGDD